MIFYTNKSNFKYNNKIVYWSIFDEMINKKN